MEGLAPGPEQALGHAAGGDRDRPSFRVALEARKRAGVGAGDTRVFRREPPDLLARDRLERAAVRGDVDRALGRPQHGAQRELEGRIGVRIVEPIAEAELDPFGAREGAAKGGVLGKRGSRQDHTRVPGVADDEERKARGPVGAARCRGGSDGTGEKRNEEPEERERSRATGLAARVEPD